MSKTYKVRLRSKALIHGHKYEPGQVVNWHDDWGAPPRGAKPIEERPKKTYVDMGAKSKKG